MTAHDPAAPEPETGTREALARALAASDPVPVDPAVYEAARYYRDFATALAPVVARIEAEAREAERERIADQLIARYCDCGDFDGHPGDCSAMPIINTLARSRP